MTDPAATTAHQPPATGGEDDRADPGVRFEDAYWDDAFCAWWDPSMRICC